MNCVKCEAENKKSVAFCETCGAPLPVIKRSYAKAAVIVFIILICAAGFAYLNSDMFLSSPQMTGTMSDAYKERQGAWMGENQEEEDQLRNPLKELSPPGSEKQKTGRAAEMSSEEVKSENVITGGWVTISDPRGRQVNKIRAGLSASGWMALPARVCLGGNKWHFNADSGWKAEISNGLWINGDRVGLWQLTRGEGDFDGPGLDSWNDREPVFWYSLESADKHLSITLSPGRSDGFFVSVSLPEQINEIGIFVQRGRIVGWSFGEWLEQGYMWPGQAGAELETRTRVKFFYDFTFAGGREDTFAKALALKEGHAGLDSLSSFIEGFMLQPKLAAEDTPHYLLPEKIVKQMRVLVSASVQRGEGSRIVDMFNSRVLKQIGDIGLLVDVVRVAADTRGFEAAIDEIEDSGMYLAKRQGSDAPVLNRLHLRFYQDWLQFLVSDRDVDKGLQTYNAAKAYYPEDPYIHLLGVEIELMNGNWREAERLLDMRNYPPAFQDRYRILARLIAELKGQEDKIVILFPRGSARIPVTAAVNEDLDQDFVVDTGASMVTIPSSTAEALRLDFVHGQRTISTAGGVLTVNEVIIDSIEINGWVEYDIRALVLDIPDRPGLGLLGLNYLGRFQMDLQPEEGVMLLTPR